jgi:hypothetical protein
MEMKHANSFWKTIIIIYLVAFTGAVGIILHL